jgi:hypothetical protein
LGGAIPFFSAFFIGQASNGRVGRVCVFWAGSCAQRCSAG